jgi:CHAT domain-containing protein
LLSIGELQLAQSAPQPAQESLQSALTILQTIGNRADEAKAMFGLARAERDLGNLRAAQQQIEAALTKAEAARTNIGSQQLRASYLASVHQYYELNLTLLMRLHEAHPTEGYEALALEASERSRARSLLELLTEARANLRSGGDAELLAREQSLAQQLNAKAQRQLQLTAQRSPAAQLQTLKQEISALEDEYNQVEAAIRQRSPRYAAPQPLSLREIQAQLDADSLLLEYALGTERSWLWAVTKTSITSFALPKRAQIEAVARQAHQAVLARGQRQRGETARQRETRIAQADAQWSEAAARLSEMILSPAAALLENRQLILVADGALQSVPFAALPVVSSQLSVTSSQNNRQPTTDNRQPLLAHHELITLPSASALALLRKELSQRQPAPKAIAVFADPVFTRDDARRRSQPSKANLTSRSIVHETETAGGQAAELIIPRLPFTRLEAEQILALAPKADNLQVMDFKANRAAALHPDLRQYRYLHFATHGLLDSERPGLSALVLSLVDEQGKPQDGFLRAHELYNLQLPAELVVLSACQTGLGKDVKGEGLVGLTRGFLSAGAARVVVSLWNVNDRATAELMTKFYRQMLQAGARPAAALRAAQLELGQQKQWHAPYYWAAFTLQGEWR